MGTLSSWHVFWSFLVVKADTASGIVTTVSSCICGDPGPSQSAAAASAAAYYLARLRACRVAMETNCVKLRVAMETNRVRRRGSG